MPKGRQLRKYPGPDGSVFNEYATEDDWLSARLLRVQASEIATLFIDEIEEQGQKTYETPYTLALAKMGQNTKIFSKEAKQRNWFSHRAETMIGEYWREQEPCHSTWRANTHTILTRDGLEDVGATLDFMTVIPREGGAMPLECKAAGDWGQREWRDGDVPLKFLAQANLQMAVTDTERAVVFCLIGGYTPKWTIIERDQQLIDIAVLRAQEFMDNVRNGRLPRPDGRQQTSRALALLHPEDNNCSVGLPDDADGWYEKLEFLKLRKKDVERREEELKNWVKEKIGDNSYGETDKVEFSWKREGGKPDYLKVPLNQAQKLAEAGVEFQINKTAKRRTLRKREK